LDKIFADEYPDTKFLAGGNCHDVISDRLALIGAIKALSNGAHTVRMIDRDNRSDEQISELQAQNVKVLSRRQLESYLFDDEVLDALCESVSMPDKKQDVRAAAATAVQNSVKQGHSHDDIKKATRGIYTGATQILSLTNHGSDVRSFMRSTLAPLFKPGMNVYEELKNDIFSTRHD
jgi:hypothetical protein